MHHVHNSTVSKQLRYSLTQESVYQPFSWDEAPYAVAKNIMTKHYNSATISLKKKFAKEDKLIPVITITVYLGTEGDNRLYRIQDINQAAFRGTAECV